MSEQKRIVVERNTRHLVSTPPKIPTPAPKQTPFLNPYGMSSEQINRINKTVATKRSQRITKPLKVVRARHTSPEILLSVPTNGVKYSVEYPTPDWFRQSEKVDVSVIVPLYKSQLVIQDLIRTWPLESRFTWEIVFVDDACPNNSKDMVLQCWSHRRNVLHGPVGKIVFNTENKGYGLACNTGAEYASGDYLIFLNADTQVTPGWIEPIVQLLQDDSIGIVGNLQLKEGGTWNDTIDGAGSEWLWETGCFEHIGRHSYHHRLLAQPMKPSTAPKDVLAEGDREMVTGCRFGIRRNLFRYVGGFNANYRIGYWEDAELCLSIRELGYKVFFTPNSVIHHKLSHTHSGSHAFSQFNKQFFYNRWVKSGRIDPLIRDRRNELPKVGSVLVRRSGARGDVLVAAGVASALKKKHNCEVLFITDCDSVIKDHPFIDRILPYDEVSDRLFQVFYDLDMVYEYRPHANILSAYAEYVGVKTNDCDVCVSTEYVNVPSGCIAVHAGHTLWTGRNWYTKWFADVADRLREQGHKIICVGGKGDGLVPCDIDLRESTNIAQLAHVLSQCKLFIGIDSFPMHIAQAVHCPGICFFGCINPRTRIYRENMVGVTAEIPCLGCHHRKPAPCVVTNTCETGNEDCVKLFTVDMMMSKITELLG